MDVQTGASKYGGGESVLNNNYAHCDTNSEQDTATILHGCEFEILSNQLVVGQSGDGDGIIGNGDGGFGVDIRQIAVGNTNGEGDAVIRVGPKYDAFETDDETQVRYASRKGSRSSCRRIGSLLLA